MFILMAMVRQRKIPPSIFVSITLIITIKIILRNLFAIKKLISLHIRWHIVERVKEAHIFLKW